MMPLLTPEFTNPLFLKTLLRGLERDGAEHFRPQARLTSAKVFEHYLKSKADRITNRLNLDPVVRPRPERD